MQKFFGSLSIIGIEPGHGADYYRASEVDAEIAKLKEALRDVIEQAEDFIGTDSGFPFEEAVKRAKLVL